MKSLPEKIIYREVQVSVFMKRDYAKRLKQHWLNIQTNEASTTKASHWHHVFVTSIFIDGQVYR